VAALARTRRAFKEPALRRTLGRVVCDLSPLARCLPEACYRSSTEVIVPFKYSVKLLSDTEYLSPTILQSLAPFTDHLRRPSETLCGVTHAEDRWRDVYERIKGTVGQVRGDERFNSFLTLYAMVGLVGAFFLGLVRG
ncbi:hypothetical protein EV363DRAFT_1176700, partial [Boletus edulis]